ncbi:hypothetical protein [Kineosporia succinea]|uniref:Uncharacterized protein n=1 Tax=Kineosporia succinea TaxID=84632 RepID=A0ABT9P678_9ACTN|nr:hypothetical protein [Kineosporia succinea]MDP9828076.1 hypothetical protein [Kineosporia succinea]
MRHRGAGRHCRPRPLLRTEVVWQTMPGGWSRPIVFRPRIRLRDVTKFAGAVALLLPLHAVAAALTVGALLLALDRVAT